ncbi:MAG: hypothetical protein WC073_16785, partial [Sterolibacterium sp.]
MNPPIDLRKLQLRSVLASLTVALGVCVTIAIFHEEYDYIFIPYLGVSHHTGDTIGIMFTMAFTYAATHLLSRAVFKDMSFGLSAAQQSQEALKTGYAAVADQVAQELRQVGTYNNVVRGQLDTVVQETEKAAFDIASRLQ